MAFAPGTIARLRRCQIMNLEKQALQDHAERCRQTAAELDGEPAQRLRAMADDYEARAERLEQQETQLRDLLTLRRRRSGPHGLRNSTTARE